MLYQTLEMVGDLLIGARGSYLDLINFRDTTLVSSWKCPLTCSKQNQQELQDDNKLNKGSEILDCAVESNNSPPIKKIKLSQSKNRKLDTSFNHTDGSEPGCLKDQNNLFTIDSPNISLLTSTNDGKNVIIVTREDKSIRVLEIIGTGNSRELIQLSQRPMPKRPCAFAISDDNLTIISADKFGDVYSLPLLYLPKTTVQESAPESLDESLEPKLAYFTPAASELTVHSERNKKALESQRKQKYQNSQKQQISFSCELLLGHVSMLTDVKLAKVGGKSYLITSDRDEHIRVSRGIPQTHVIENYCLGHTEFVSRLCIPETKPKILISGGGDNELFVWDWVHGSLLSKTDLYEHIKNVRKKLSAELNKNETMNSQIKVAVSGILHVSLLVDSKVVSLILVSCERLPAFFTFCLSPENKLEYSETVWTSGNILSMSTASVQNSMVKSLFVSIDNLHKPGSSLDIREDISSILSLCRFDFDGVNLKSIPLIFKVPVDKEFEGMCKNSGQISDLLYSIESLRKKYDEV
ncbi:putative trna methyltransferase [Erysiphe necator]|uniref:Putative trna methyltransferase n=1 Tax=Uncinula necator TaxID=52586 RepID=A0A0B1P3X0_UNCNE|nr:putative trna methyltransferase [Erysiphe necator]